MTNHIRSAHGYQGPRAYDFDLPRTREELAEELGISPNRVGQLERRALAKLRAEAERRGLKLEDLL